MVAKYILGDPLAPWHGGAASLTSEFIKKNPELSKKYIAAYARGRRNPTLRSLAAIARALGIEVWELLRGPLPGQGLPDREAALRDNIRWFQRLGPSQKLRAQQAQQRAGARLARLRGDG